MTSLTVNLREFAAALRDPAREVPAFLAGPGGEASARRFAVYRNNVFVGLTDALRAGFPCVSRLVGEEFFTAMARVYAAAEPPRSPVLLHYGAGFPNFIASFAPAAGLPYLADVARIERAATEAYHAREAVPLPATAFANVSPEQAPSLGLTLHPSLRLLRSRYPACTIWKMNAGIDTPRPIDLSAPQDTLVLRPEAELEICQLSAASHDFVNALGSGALLAQAAELALARDPGFDLALNLRELIRMGAVVGYHAGGGAS